MIAKTTEINTVTSISDSFKPFDITFSSKNAQPPPRKVVRQKIYLNVSSSLDSIVNNTFLR